MNGRVNIDRPAEDEAGIALRDKNQQKSINETYTETWRSEHLRMALCCW